MITPNTDVYLLKSPLELDDGNQLTFANATAQYNYFSSLPKLYLDDGAYTYQRKDGVIRVGELVDDIRSYNYVMYRNTNHGNKWFYAFITGMDYLNDNVTAVSIKTDTFQTYQFDLTYKRCFVEREHVNDDTIGLHTVPENLDIGDYIVQTEGTYNPKTTNYDKDHVIISQQNLITFQVSDLRPLYPQIGNEWYTITNGLFNGLAMFGVETSALAKKIIAIYDADDKHDAITSIFLAPAAFYDGGMRAEFNSDHDKLIIPKESNKYTTLMNATSQSLEAWIGGTASYYPKNKKLFCWPFNFLAIDNNAGGTAEFRYEDFALNNAGMPTISFAMIGSLTQGCAIKLVPNNYKGMSDASGVSSGNFSYGVVAPKFPLCAWNSDYYLNWQTQNAVSQPFGAFGVVAGAGMGIATALAFSNPFTAIAVGIGLIGAIGNSVSQKYEAEKHPNQAKGNLSAADLNIGMNGGAGNTFTVKHMTIRPEYCRICDNFLSMFGYKVNEVKIPNITGRANWNYVKTIGCYIDADIPQDDLLEIKQMFDKGITLWHNPTTFMDYSQANDII